MSAQKELEHELELIGNAIVKALRDNLDKDKSNASYELQQSIVFNSKVIVPDNLDMSEFYLYFELLMDDYWYYVDKGIKPVSASVKYKGKKKKGASKKGKRHEAIVEWLKNKESFKFEEKDKDKKGNIKYNSIAFVIARKIKKSGTKGNKFFSSIVTESWYDAFTARVENVLAKEIELNFNIGSKNKLNYNIGSKKK